VSRIAQLVNDKTPGLTDITGVRDESDENTRVVVEIKRDAVPKVIINNLFKFTALETSFAVNALAIDHGRPKTLNLKEMLNCYIEHRREVVLRRARFELKKAEEKAEQLEGYLIALANLDEIIRIIRNSSNREEAKIKLLAFEFTRQVVEGLGILIRSEDRLVSGRYALSEAQVTAILELRLYQLTGMERSKIKAEYDEIVTKIKDLLDILAREERVLTIIKNELQEIKKKYASPRLTQLVPDEGEMAIEDLIANEDVTWEQPGFVFFATRLGTVKKTALSDFANVRKGGIIAITIDSGDLLIDAKLTSGQDEVVLITKEGMSIRFSEDDVRSMGRP